MRCCGTTKGPAPQGRTVNLPADKASSWQHLGPKHGTAIWMACRLLSQFHTQWRLLQVNPLAETNDGRLVAADAKLGFDDNAAFRQKDLFAMRDTSQEDPRCWSLHAVQIVCQ